MEAYIDNKIFASYDEKTIRVYQAYNDTIADEAVNLGTFGCSFKMNRMTWIKPSFLWMMYRSGWATKEGQNRILAIDMQRTGFNQILDHTVLSSFSKEVYESHEIWKALLEKSEVRCQWDPARDIYGTSLEQRTIQLGIKGNMVKRYVHEWIVKITDITEYVSTLRASMEAKTFTENLLPIELEYK